MTPPPERKPSWPNLMLILGDISGIQTFVYDVSHEGGGQARRLRARSFFVQALCEAAAIRVLQALPWEFDLDRHLVLSAAGRFVLRGPDFAEAATVIERMQFELSTWLLQNVSGELRVSLIAADDQRQESEMQQYRLARERLENLTLRPWAALAIDNGRWQSHRLLLEPLDTPCVLCRHRSGVTTETDRETGEERRVCSLCHHLLNLGRDLPRANWVTFTTDKPQGVPSAFGLSLKAVAAAELKWSDHMVSASRLSTSPHPDEPIPHGRRLSRRLARFIPTHRNGETATFEEIAAKGTGDAKLGVMKADGDGLGVYLQQLFSGSTSLEDYRQLSRDLDDFSAGDLDELVRAKFPWIYTLYSGGDDLLFLGPWDQILEFAGHVRQQFLSRFGARGLRISAGVALVPPHWPIRRAVGLAEEQLELAKTTCARGWSQPKDQVAAFGMVWKWLSHAKILAGGRELARWVTVGAAQRGWLQRLLELYRAHVGQRNQRRLVTAGDGPNSETEWQTDPRNQLLASARLNYFVARNFPKAHDRRPDHAALRQWMDQRLRQIDDPHTADAETLYLPAILQYAILATRSKRDHDD
ncbi:MAG: type III-A CRISPR-associated protein Cas10/Csm1 [Planctomycetaceae bacterium]|nr:type III-A CRISPR-associated protein Cas10/Csm1 [Planctomycetaceae bacterium]